MADYKLTKLERVLTYWDKDDRILYAAARQAVRSGDSVSLLALEYDVDVDELQELVDQLKDYERAMMALEA